MISLLTRIRYAQVSPILRLQHELNPSNSLQAMNAASLCFQERGFHPEAIVNFIARGPLAHVDATDTQTTKEIQILNVEELMQSFSLEGINRKPTVVDEAKLLWMNKWCHKKQLNTENQLHAMAIQLQTEVRKLHK